MTAVIAVKDLSVAYEHEKGWQEVVSQLNVTIERGEILGLVGESGCGKSTVAYHLLGYRRANSRVTSGAILFQGNNVLSLRRNALDELRGNRIALVPQNPTTALSPGMRVGRQIVEALLTHRRSLLKRAARERVDELLRIVGLPGADVIAKRYPHQLSGGQQQRICIAMALACEPDLLVLDEPTTGLDVTTQQKIVRLLRSLRDRFAMSMLYVTHDLGVLSQIADRVGVMYAGQLVEVADTKTLFTSPRHPYTRGLLASVPSIADRAAARPLRGFLRREDLPPGCPFAPRCDFAVFECAHRQQTLVDIALGHHVACERWTVVGEPAASVRCSRPVTPYRKGSEPMLSVEGVSLGYGHSGSVFSRWLGRRANVAVKDVSFEIRSGETLALVGESGSGKSTIARAISGLLQPTAGRIMFQGAEVPGPVEARSQEMRRQIQFVFQNPDASLNPRSKVGDILRRPAEVFFRLRYAAVRERVAEALRLVRLDPSYAERYPMQLSGGERQRVAIARALVAEPRLLICDEILSALDVSVQASVLDLLRDLQRKSDLTMLFISHDLAVVRELADRVAVLSCGSLCEVGAAQDVFQEPKHDYTRELLSATVGDREIRTSSSLLADAKRHAESGTR